MTALNLKNRPSAAHQWSYDACPGSVQAQFGIIDAAGPSAREGTALHKILETCLKQGKDPESFIGNSLREFNREVLPGDDRPVTQEDAEGIRQAVDYVLRRVAETGSTLMVERHLDILPPACDGTADIILIQDFGVVEVIDYKSGFRKVDPVDNPQGKCYLLGAAALAIAPAEVWFTVVQPQQYEEPQTWKQDAEVLPTWMEWLKRSIAESHGPNPVRRPGEKQCQWCRARSTCPALAAEVEGALGIPAEATCEVTLEVPRDVDRLVAIMDAAPIIRSFLNAIEEEVEVRLRAGMPVPGKKLVQTYGNRAWVDPVGALRRLSGYKMPKELRMKQTPTSPTKALDWLKRNRPEKLRLFEKKFVHRPLGALKVVGMDDKREAVVVDPSKILELPGPEDVGNY